MGSNRKRCLELLAPAADAEVAIEAIRHGADAVYIGAESHGARKAAANSIDDIRRVVDFAHIFRARVYVTVNTIVYEDELKEVEALCWKLYHVGVDALIVQDMAMLRLNLPPIALHASTQCDIRTPEKALFLQEAGMSQLVLARELTIPEIKAIVDVVSIPVECFIHGALCVSYSGRCHASCAANGRSANRGECAQLCRLPYTLYDGEGNILVKDRHLLSLRDFNASESLPDLVEAGVRSFKIEGRLKDKYYVKNIVAYYNRILDDFIARNNDSYCRSSFGRSEACFKPSPDKSFNRGFTDYFLSSRRPDGLASLYTPKSQGEVVKDIRYLHNGDGISYFDGKGLYQGANVNRIEGGRIFTNKGTVIPKNVEIHRTSDIEWQKIMAKETAIRKMWVDISLSENSVWWCDERGVEASLSLDVPRERADKPMDFKQVFSKLGNTDFYLRTFECSIPENVFIPRSALTDLRRKLIELVGKANLATYRFDTRRKENPEIKYYLKKLDFRDNVSNSLAVKFYRDHGVVSVEKAMEISGRKINPGTVVMTARHCILREIGLCKRLAGRNIKGPLTLESGSHKYRLHFNCADCEMEVLTM